MSFMSESDLISTQKSLLIDENIIILPHRKITANHNLYFTHLQMRALSFAVIGFGFVYPSHFRENAEEFTRGWIISRNFCCSNKSFPSSFQRRQHSGKYMIEINFCGRHSQFDTFICKLVIYSNGNQSMNKFGSDVKLLWAIQNKHYLHWIWSIISKIPTTWPQK